MRAELALLAPTECHEHNVDYCFRLQGRRELMIMPRVYAATSDDMRAGRFPSYSGGHDIAPCAVSAAIGRAGTHATRRASRRTCHGLAAAIFITSPRRYVTKRYDARAAITASSRLPGRRCCCYARALALFVRVSLAKFDGCTILRLLRLVLLSPPRTTYRAYENTLDLHFSHGIAFIFRSR